MFKFAQTAAAVVMCAALQTATAGAQVIQSMGAGSAVQEVHASAFFESEAALWDNPYIENGLQFSRTGLSFNNNKCGFAGCKSIAGLSGFEGNYMYGEGLGYFSMRAPTGTAFRALEFLLGNAWVDGGSWSVSWSAWRNSTEVGAGTIDEFNFLDIVGFSSESGFDELRYTDLNRTSGAAFDDVHAEYIANVSTVPEPSSWVMIATGLLVLAAFAHRSSKREAARIEALSVELLNGLR
ncbi:MAG: PEP-CTERM sorting domain-containing protein [Gemmatimonas sp.]